MIMPSDQVLEVIEARLVAVSGIRWEVIELDGRQFGIDVIFADGHRTMMQVTRDRAPASNVDVLFIGHARSDMQRLLLAIHGELALSPRELAEIEARCRAASSAPWTAFIEADGGLGGCDMIRVSDQDREPDLYLWFGPGLVDLAPSANFRFVAAARQDILDLIKVSSASATP
jgi:hypothetical protein